MPVVFQTVIKREDARRNPNILYVFGDNVQRVGNSGQAKELRGEPNGVGIVTKITPWTYFQENAVDVFAQNRTIDDDMKPLFHHVNRGGIVVWPSKGIGTGSALLQFKAPSTFDHIKAKLLALIRAGVLFDKANKI